MNARLRLITCLTAGLAPWFATPVLAYTPVSELKDVGSDHWAREAIVALVEKYEVMDGFSDKTFRGSRTLTRYELAAALAKVMAKVEEQIASATGNPISLDPSVNTDDLRTIARLQREFRDELEVLKGRTDSLDSRLSTVEKRARLSGEIRNEYRSYLGAMPAAQWPTDDTRVRSRLNLDAALADDVAAHSSLFWDVYGPVGAGAAFATPGRPDTPFTEAYLSRAYVSYTPGTWALHTGVMNASDVLTLGSSFKNPFTQNVWRDGLGGYGFVGTPGLALGSGDLVARLKLNGEARPANPAWWLPGTDVALQALDPNATQPLAPRGNYMAAAGTQMGPFQLGLAYYQGGLSGRDVERLNTLGYADSLPQLEGTLPGGRMLATVGGDFGVVRAQLAAKTVGLPTDAPDAANKTLTSTLDVGSEALGLSLQTVSRTAFTGNFNPSQASLTLASNDLFGTGFGLGLGLNAGSVVGTRLSNGQPFQFSGRNLMQGLAGADYASYGATLRIPGFSIFPHLTLAAQQTGGPNLERTLGSGLTLQTEIQIAQLPRIQVEYSSGKFDPGTDNGLLNNAALVSHELLAAQMLVPF
ncbi:MAG: iron uptake porin [Candidatus Sericytochromatia bacterium]|nr:iron uptake porin [Candidatus Sericytochromatia bacterium]